MVLSFSVLIADDDEGMRLVLKKSILKHKGFDIVGEAADGSSALRLAMELEPNIIFMDVEMPEMTGIECAKRIMDKNPKTIILFATAHEEYMTEAFTLYAFDYLVKPFKLDRLNQTLQRIQQLNLLPESIHSDKIQKHEISLGKLLIKNKEGISFVNEHEIIVIQREDRNTVIYTEAEKFMTSESLSDLENRLDKNTFFRSHKSYIINLAMIHKIYPYGRWTYIIKFSNTERDALVTHDKFEELQGLFK